MDMARELAQFIVNTNYEDIPEYVIETQKKSIIDQTAITLGASTLGYGCDQMVQLAKELASGGKEEATVVGYDCKLPAAWAAFANGAMAHALDFGDMQMYAHVHSNASPYPAGIAVAERLGNVTGKQLLTALVIGSEVACRISLGVRQDLEKFGFYMPTIYTSFGATATVCKLLGLNEDQCVDALTFNLCQTTCSAELINSGQTPVRGIREAFASRNAVVSAYMAQKGLKGFDNPLEGPLGFYMAYGRETPNRERAMKDLGKVFYAGTLYYKLWPTCASTHSALRCITKLMKEQGLKPEEIERIHVEAPIRTKIVLEPDDEKKHPHTSIVAKFSIPYTCSVTLFDGTVGIGDFNDESYNRKDVNEMADKFTHEINENWGKDEAMNTRVTVYTKDRGELTEFYTEVGVDPEVTPYEDVVLKLKNCAKFASHKRTEEQLDKLAEAVKNLDQLSDIREFTKYL